MTGFLLIHKPVGISSFLVVKKLRFLTKVKKIGYAGTLDPFASGLLIVALGRDFTRKIDMFVGLPKTYTTRMVLGLTTDTLDSYGTLAEQKQSALTKEKIQETLQNFIGPQVQIPPMFSAKKKNGQRLYTLARQGIEIERAPQAIHIYSLDMQTFIPGTYPMIDLTLRCSKGTYVRSLVRDLGTALGTVAYTKDLCRSAIGNYTLDQALYFQDLTPEIIEKALRHDA